MTASISSLNALSSLLGWTATSASDAPMASWSTIHNDVLTAVAGKLGISGSDLATQLKTGKSMAQVASAAGVSSNDLAVTIQGALVQSNLPAGVNLATMATGMANNVNNASLDYQPSTAATPSAMPSPAAGSTSHGIDTSALRDVNLGGLSLDSSEITLLFGARGSTLDGYL
jgi:hypothetical protein